MERHNFVNLFHNISGEGWRYAFQVVDTAIEESQYSLDELAGPYFQRMRQLKNQRGDGFTHINPIDRKKFSNKGFRPDQGFFKTFSKVYIPIKEFNKPNAKFGLYRSYKGNGGYEATYIVALEVVYKLLKAANLEYVLDGISIGIIPNLMGHGKANVDAYGVYADISGGYEYILVADQIKEEVVTDFEEVTREKILSQISSAEYFNNDVAQESRKQILLRAITILHELGHRVEVRSFKDQQRILFEMWQKYKKSAGISKYGIVHYREWFAECFVAWVVDGLSYSNAVKEDFRILLYGGGAAPALSQESINTFSQSIQEKIIKELETTGIEPGAKFTLGVAYLKGPAQFVNGIFKAFIPGEIPTLQYIDPDGREKAFNWFPGRDVKKIILEAGWEEESD